MYPILSLSKRHDIYIKLLKENCSNISIAILLYRKLKMFKQLNKTCVLTFQDTSTFFELNMRFYFYFGCCVLLAPHYYSDSMQSFVRPFARTWPETRKKKKLRFRHFHFLPSMQDMYEVVQVEDVLRVGRTVRGNIMWRSWGRAWNDDKWSKPKIKPNPKSFKNSLAEYLHLHLMPSMNILNAFASVKKIDIQIPFIIFYSLSSYLNLHLYRRRKMFSARIVLF